MDDQPIEDSAPAAPAPNSADDGSLAAMAPYVLPLVVYMAAGSLAPPHGEAAGGPFGLTYPVSYAVKIAATAVAVAWACGVWFREHPLRVSPPAWGIGVASTALWVGLAEAGRDLCRQEFMQPVLSLTGEAGPQRPGFNPWEHFGDDVSAWSFLAVRLLGLAALVPLIEEFFLRGFVVRYVMEPRWKSLPVGAVDAKGWAAALLVPLLYHPMSERLAALAWFGLVTWYVARTRRIWDAVAIHAATNLTLGVYVLATKSWYLW